MQFFQVEIISQNSKKYWGKARTKKKNNEGGKTGQTPRDGKKMPKLKHTHARTHTKGQVVPHVQMHICQLCMNVLCVLI